MHADIQICQYNMHKTIHWHLIPIRYYCPWMMVLTSFNIFYFNLGKKWKKLWTAKLIKSKMQNLQTCQYDWTILLHDGFNIMKNIVIVIRHKLLTAKLINNATIDWLLVFTFLWSSLKLNRWKETSSKENYHH